MGSLISRRTVLIGMGASAASLAACKTPVAREGSTLAFREISLMKTPGEVLPEGYRSRVIIRWGDALFEDVPDFDPATLTPDIAARQFGVNNDFLAFLPLGDDPSRGLLYANHEYPNPHLMWTGLSEHSAAREMTDNQVAVTMASVGGSVVELRKADGAWQPVRDSQYNRRITATTPMRISGPAAGHPRLQTQADPTGTRVLGTLSNCNGGVTPWGTILTCEEGAGEIFGGDWQSAPDHALLKRYYYDDTDNDRWGWTRVAPRFSLENEPNEPNRYEWVVEIDPADPTSTPVKRTALGRFAHEGASTILAPDGRVVVYLGDDWEFEYCYRFVSTHPVRPGGAAANRDLLDEGVLFVAQFEANGQLKWIPLVFGQGPLIPENGFHSQGDVLINTRGAADLVGATPMDSPEGFAPNPVTGTVIIALTSNDDRSDPDPANPRANNRYGHLLELRPPQTVNGRDHAADTFAWEVLALCGDPATPDHATRFHPATSSNGWFTDPDNIGFDPTGRLWICTDGVQPSGHDGLYAMDLEGYGRALPKLFYAPPAGAECCSPTFIDNGATLLLGIQHPGEGAASLDLTPTRWPDFDPTRPPRPSIVAIRQVAGRSVGD
ncbi:PhoX family protein [Hyphomonas oceanitis]|uniref:PhoX family protein n=1 Tax=Hyphomonas oceanitis TaxID=81033 RepID=UPI0019D706FA|nr:PhoX family phosphatase [Hyphomonas oceanitis]